MKKYMSWYGLWAIFVRACLLPIVLPVRVWEYFFGEFK